MSLMHHFFYNGYHIFYQANLHALSWDSIQWGHLASKDMVHWKDLPLTCSQKMVFDEWMLVRKWTG